MKYLKYILCVGVILAVGRCNIEDSVKDASKKCEDEIAKVVQSVESVCLTKEEILELIYAVRNRGIEESDAKHESR